MPEYDRLRYDELASISEFLHGLSDEQWDHESLCAGWQVRHVVSHMTLGYTTPFLEMIKNGALQSGQVSGIGLSQRTKSQPVLIKLEQP